MAVLSLGRGRTGPSFTAANVNTDVALIRKKTHVFAVLRFMMFSCCEVRVLVNYTLAKRLEIL